MTRDLLEKFVPLSSANGGGHKTYTCGAGAATVYIPAQVRGVLVQALTQNIRFTLDGTNPTASKGFRLTAGNDPIYIELDPKISLKVVAETAGAILEYEFCDVNNRGTLG
jgi:hypothetical protein